MLVSQLLEPKQLALLVGLPQPEPLVRLWPLVSLVDLLWPALLANLLRLSEMALQTRMLEPTRHRVSRCCCCWFDRLCLQRSRRFWHRYRLR